MRKKIKVIDVTGYNANQIESGINTALSKGWEFVQIVVVGNKVFVVIQKSIVA